MFNVAKPEDIKAGKVTDVYFERAINVLKVKGINKYVKAEFVVKKFNFPQIINGACSLGLMKFCDFSKVCLLHLKLCLREQFLGRMNQ